MIINVTDLEKFSNAEAMARVVMIQLLDHLISSYESAEAILRCHTTEFAEGRAFNARANIAYLKGLRENFRLEDKSLN